MSHTPSRLSAYFESNYLTENLRLSPLAADQYRIAIRQLNRFTKRETNLGDLSKDLILRFIRHLKADGKLTERTINNKRQALLTVWRAAAAAGLCSAPGRIPKLSEPRRIVRAWTVEELARILDACDLARPLPNWTAAHWRALILTAYDTSHRLGALLKTARAGVDASGYLLVVAEHSKQRTDKLHRLHPETLETIRSLPPAELLFPWPLRKRAIWIELKKILTAAKLPATRRDLFHKLRRTSFTYTYALLGPEAARDQAAHTTDLSKSYLDHELLRRLQNRPAPVDVLPRPKPFRTCDQLPGIE